MTPNALYQKWMCFYTPVLNYVKEMFIICIWFQNQFTVPDVNINVTTGMCEAVMAEGCI